MPHASPRLAAVLMVKNEAGVLGDCLSSVEGLADEVCVLDTGSTDRTVEIARAHGARVERFDWSDDFAEARNRSLAMTDADWILLLDADERLERDAHDLIREAIAKPDALAYWLTIQSWYGDRPGKRFELSTSIRLFRNVPDARFVGALHEMLTPEFRARALPAPNLGVLIEHLGYLDSFIHDQGKRERNFRAACKALEANPDSSYEHFNVGALSFGRGDVVRCEAECRESLRLWRRDRPQNEYVVFCLTMLARVCVQDGRVWEGLGILRDGLRFVRHPEMLCATGEILIQTRDYEGGIAMLRQAQETAAKMLAGEIAYGSVDPGLAHYRTDTLIGHALLKMGRTAEARQHLERALEASLVPQAMTLELLARCVEAEGFPDEAARLRERAAEPDAARDFAFA